MQFSPLFVGTVVQTFSEGGPNEVAVVGTREMISRWLASRRRAQFTSFLEDDGYEHPEVFRVLKSGRLARRPEPLDSF